MPSGAHRLLPQQDHQDYPNSLLSSRPSSRLSSLVNGNSLTSSLRFSSHLNNRSNHSRLLPPLSNLNQASNSCLQLSSPFLNLVFRLSHLQVALPQAASSDLLLFRHQGQRLLRRRRHL